MKTTNSGVFQVVLDPDDADVQMTEELVNEMLAPDRAAAERVFSSGTERVKYYLGYYLHGIGLHHFVPLKRWDQGSQRVIHTPHLVCMWCEKTKEE